MGAFTTFRNADLSLLQSAFHSVLARKGVAGATQLGAPHPQMADFNHVLTALQAGQPAPTVASDGTVIDECARLGARLAWAKISGDTATAATLESELQFSTCDPLWAEVVAEYLAFKLSKKDIPYRGYGADLTKYVLALPAPDDNGLRIAVIADWGTGTQEAAELLAAVMAQKPHVLIHLGDVYYSGTQDEMSHNFLALIQAAGVSIPVYTLTGNHDMYSGGQGYYWLIDQLGQPASYFCLRNEQWQFLAMDTGYHDCDPESVDTNVTYLEPAEELWHQDKLANAGGRKTVLLSHHQLFTFAESCGQLNGVDLAFNPRLNSTFGPAIANGQVALWLWGHEHNFIVYEPYLGLNRSACIGAGGVPVLVESGPYNPNTNLQNPPGFDPAAVLQNNGTDYNRVFAMISLNGSDGRIDYYQVDANGQQVPGSYPQSLG